MTNFEHYKNNLTIDIFVGRMIMDCRYCPVKHPHKGVCSLTRKDCDKKLREWCDKEWKE